MSTLEAMMSGWLSGMEPPPIARFLGIEMKGCAGGQSALAMRVGLAHHNPLGTVHGGILCDLADAAMGMAVASMLNPAESFTTAQLSAHFLAPMIEGEVMAHGKVVRKGGSAAFVECELIDDAGRLIGKFDSTCLIRRAFSVEPDPG